MRLLSAYQTNTSERRGFTLLELLVVMAIIGILAGIVLASLNIARTRAEESRIKVESQEILKALELYYTDNGEYPEVGQVVELSDVSSTVYAAIIDGGYLGGVPEEAVRFAYCSTQYGRTMLLAVNTNYDTGTVGSEYCHIIRGPEDPDTAFANNGCAFAAGQAANQEILADDPCSERY